MRKITMVVALAGAMVGCKKKDNAGAGSASGTATASASGSGTATGAQTPVAPKPLAGEELAKRYQECWDLWNADKFDEFAGCYADDIVTHQLGMPDITGKPAVLAFSKGWATAFPDGAAEPQLTLVNGQHIVSVRWFHGSHTGPLAGPAGEIPATNKKVGFLALHHVLMNEKNQVAQEWWAYDPATMMFQLGLSPGPARPVMEKGMDGAPMVVVAKNDETEKKNADGVRAAYAAWNKRDKAFDDMLADDIVESMNMEPADSVGKKAIQEHNAGFRAAFSDIHVDVDDVWAVGDYTFSVEHVRGTNDGDMGPMKKTGKKLDLTVNEILQWKDGKVVKSWPFASGMEMAMQLGLM